MLRIVVDSGSSIKQEEKELYGVDILPLRVQMREDSFLDGVNLSIDEFYNRLINLKEFPKTSLPSLEDAENLVTSYTEQGDDVLIITISSGISGTFQTMKMLFEENDKVTVFDSQMAVGGVRFLVQEARKYEHESMDIIIEKLNDLVPRIVTAAIPETLDYLLAGGRLTKLSWMLGTMLSIKPVIGFVDSKVTVLSKKRGLKQAMKQIVDMAVADLCDPEFGIVASYTYNKDNIDEVIKMSPEKIQKMVKCYDNLIPSIACHWGPNAFGYIYVKSKL